MKDDLDHDPDLIGKTPQGKTDMHVSLMVAITADGKIARDVDHYPDWTGKADKKFSAHLTIGRIKNPHGLESFIGHLEKVEFQSGEFEVGEVIVFKSDLSPRGPTYTPLAKIPIS